jgi:hypothetical protein
VQFEGAGIPVQGEYGDAQVVLSEGSKLILRANDVRFHDEALHGFWRNGAESRIALGVWNHTEGAIAQRPNCRGM